MKKKLAVVDLLAHYPPTGGACLDVFKTAAVLKQDYDLCLFYPQWNGAFSRGINLNQPPVRVQAAPVDDVKREKIVESLTEAISGFSPDAVLVTDGWTLKPYLVKALSSRFPVITRLYAFEMLCPRNNERWMFDRPCANTALMDCGQCLACARKYCNVVKQHKGKNGNPLTDEMNIARIWDGDYENTLIECLQKSTAVIVYNHAIAGHLQQQLGIVATVVPGGFEPDSDDGTPLFSRNDSPTEFKILVFGRMDDPAKGAAVAVKAGRILKDCGVPVLMTITRTPQSAEPWLREIGWQTRHAVKELLSTHDVVIVPSLWEEAFGMTWLESLASGVPVVASATGGPLEYLTDGQNALLFPPGNAPALAEQLARLYHDPVLRRKLAQVGYQYARKNLTWQASAGKTSAVIDNSNIRQIHSVQQYDAPRAHVRRWTAS